MPGLKKTINLGLSFAILVLLCLANIAPAFAANDFITDKEEGWFWYEREPEPPKAPEPPRPIPQKPTPQIIKPKAPEPKKPTPLTVEWFQKEYLNVMYAAIDNPTQENVRRYRYSTRVMLDKASNFAHMFQQESLLDPLLDEANRMPFSSAARGGFMRLTFTEQRKATEAIGKKGGLWVFLDESCEFCAIQYPIIDRMAKEHKMEVTYITPDGSRPPWMDKSDDLRKDSGQSKVLRIGVRPAIAFVVPPNDITVLTQGMISQDMIEERILFAGDRAGLLTAEISRKAFPERNGLLTPEDIRNIGEEMQKNPEGITRAVQDRLENRYQK